MKKLNILLLAPSIKNNGGITTVLINYISSKHKNLNFYHLTTQRDGFFLWKIFIFLYAFFVIKLVIKKNNIDIVHIHMSESGSFYRTLLLLKRISKMKCKTIIHHHGAEFLKWYNNLSVKQKNNVVQTLNSVNLNIVLSKKLMDEYKSHFNIFNIEYLYNSVKVPPKNLYNINSEYILFLGRFGKRKGIYDLLSSIKLLDKKIDNKFKFILCGDGEIEKVNKMISELKIENRCIVKGWIEQDEKDLLLKNAILNVLPSYNEGLPMSLIECMSYGIPCISTNIASIPELIDENNGFLIEPGFVECIANSINKFITLKDEDKKFLSDNAYNTICENFSNDANFDRLYLLYMKLYK